MHTTVTYTTPVVPAIREVVITLSAEEAMKLRRVCYYNKTVSERFVNNPNGGYNKAIEVETFMSDLGNSLKTNGVVRF